MPQVNVYEAKTQLSKLLDAVERGDSITIARNGRPIADLVPHTHAVPIRFGGLVDEIRFDDASFIDADDEVAQMFDLIEAGES